MMPTVRPDVQVEAVLSSRLPVSEEPRNADARRVPRSLPEPPAIPDFPTVQLNATLAALKETHGSSPLWPQLEAAIKNALETTPAARVQTRMQQIKQLFDEVVKLEKGNHPLSRALYRAQREPYKAKQCDYKTALFLLNNVGASGQIDTMLEAALKKMQPVFREDEKARRASTPATNSPLAEPSAGGDFQSSTLRALRAVRATDVNPTGLANLLLAFKAPCSLSASMLDYLAKLYPRAERLSRSNDADDEAKRYSPERMELIRVTLQMAETDGNPDTVIARLATLLTEKREAVWKAGLLLLTMNHPDGSAYPRQIRQASFWRSPLEASVKTLVPPRFRERYDRAVVVLKRKQALDPVTLGLICRRPEIAEEIATRIPADSRERISIFVALTQEVKRAETAAKQGTRAQFFDISPEQLAQFAETDTFKKVKLDQLAKNQNATVSTLSEQNYDNALQEAGRFAPALVAARQALGQRNFDVILNNPELYPQLLAAVVLRASHRMEWPKINRPEAQSTFDQWLSAYQDTQKQDFAAALDAWYAEVKQGNSVTGVQYKSWQGLGWLKLILYSTGSVFQEAASAENDLIKLATATVPAEEVSRVARALQDLGFRHQLNPGVAALVTILPGMTEEITALAPVLSKDAAKLSHIYKLIAHWLIKQDPQTKEPLVDAIRGNWEEMERAHHLTQPVAHESSISRRRLLVSEQLQESRAQVERKLEQIGRSIEQPKELPPLVKAILRAAEDPESRNFSPSGLKSELEGAVLQTRWARPLLPVPAGDIYGIDAFAGRPMTLSELIGQRSSSAFSTVPRKRGSRGH